MQRLNKPYDWIEDVFKNIDAQDTDESIKVLENCGKICGESDGLQKEALRIRSELGDTDDLNLLFEVYKEQAYENSPRLYKKNNAIYLEYHQCGCPLVTSGKIKDPLFCNCTRGYTKARFETLFNKPVTVILEKAILKGDEICKQKIVVDGIVT